MVDIGLKAPSASAQDDDSGKNLFNYDPNDGNEMFAPLQDNAAEAEHLDQ